MTDLRKPRAPIWKQAATREELRAVAKLDRQLAKIDKQRLKLAMERGMITNRCLNRQLQRRQAERNKAQRAA